MTTAYTQFLLDNADATFADFALRCARAMGALVHMRDMPLDAPLPDEIRPDERVRERLEEAYARCRELDVMTMAEAERRAEEEYERLTRERAKAVAKRAEENRRLTEMLAQVEAWKLPTPRHAGLQKFMREQIEMSIHRPIDWPVLRVSGRGWLDNQREDAARDLRSAAEDWEQEQRRARERTEWLMKLRASLEEVDGE